MGGLWSEGDEEEEEKKREIDEDEFEFDGFKEEDRLEKVI
jgi:hypothetical protein